MGKIVAHVSDEIDHAFRVKIAQNGGKRGDLSVAVEEALKLYIQSADRGCDRETLSEQGQRDPEFSIRNRHHGIL